MFSLSACMAMGWITHIHRSPDLIAIQLNNGKWMVLFPSEFNARFKA